jgi:hypothetical protein
LRHYIRSLKKSLAESCCSEFKMIEAKGTIGFFILCYSSLGASLFLIV